jgi:hypothetical protein
MSVDGIGHSRQSIRYLIMLGVAGLLAGLVVGGSLALGVAALVFMIHR